MPPRRKGPSERIATRGTARMRELGMKSVTLWFNPEELAVISSAAQRAKKRPAKWIREKVYQAAVESAREARQEARRDASGK